VSGSDERQGERIDEAVPALSIDAIDEAPPAADPEGARLDPVDQQAFRATAHALLDTCLDRLENARELPWQPPPDALPGDLHGLPEPVPRSGVPLAQISRELGESVMPYATGNTHPRFFGWVHGTGLADGLLSDMVAATMNANCGGRRHIGIDIERRVIDWCASMHGLPETAGGLITSGTSMATLLALQAARVQRFGQALRTEGQREPAVLYAAAGTHQCVARAAELLGLGREAVRTLPLDRANGSACLKTLSRLVAEDRAAGRVPLCLVGTAGSVDTGRFDDLAALADAAAEHEVWFHVDGAFGAWAVIAEEPWRSLANGLERADSMAFDFHKWPYVGYSAGAVLVRDGATLGAAFSGTAAYLESDEDDALAAGAPWPCDLGPELSRGFLALKVWTALRRHGIEALGAAISDNCRQAALLAERVEATPQLRLVAPVHLNVCCFALADGGADPDARHRHLAAALQLSGEVVLSTTRRDGRLVLRAAFCNHRTRSEDVLRLVEAVLDEAAGSP